MITKFKKEEIVYVSSEEEPNKYLGIVTNISEKNSEKVVYTLWIEDIHELCDFEEQDLTSTGRFVKFQSYEIVNISSVLEPTLNEGVIYGRAINENGEVGYAVWVEKERCVYSFDEHELKSTGKFETPPKTLGSIKVMVDPESGEGYIIDDEQIN